MFQRIVIILAWLMLLAIAFATLSPIGLRPHLGDVSGERFLAFAALALLFGMAYPRHLWLVAFMVGGVAVGLEVLQHLTPDRHGRVPDALVKLSGGFAGAGLAYVLSGTMRKMSSPD
ncbi:VanZ family protein [Rhodopseudomonas boonkerdii]|uniref:VanZ family protein n=1 Tax=Rhodopseudomonas boonkerdii TaxID=475937 RepID=UPI001E38B59A|nr:VanZ family protein [Rhodopseudomonas boonkerdii]UGV25072.1 VanZ family protein [Rhodopseudomonas boonkerdii]